jgi:hypothetical protein
MMVFVTSVVPWTTRVSRLPSVFELVSNASVPLNMASLGSFGVVSTLPIEIRPLASSRSTKSVNVPPTSTPRL